jgi:hypothetical protein
VRGAISDGRPYRDNNALPPQLFFPNLVQYLKFKRNLRMNWLPQLRGRLVAERLDG